MNMSSDNLVLVDDSVFEKKFETLHEVWKAEQTKKNNQTTSDPQDTSIAPVSEPNLLRYRKN